MKRVKAILVVISLVILVTYIIGFIPLEYNVFYEGTKYSYDRPDFTEKTNIQFEGTRFNKLYKCDEFYGKMIIEGVEYSKIEIKPDGDNREILMAFDSDLGEYIIIGVLYTENNFTEFIILYFEGTDGQSSWNSKNGMIYSFPATNRDEAFEITNRLIMQ